MPYIAIPWWSLLAAFFLGALVSLGGVTLGGLFVFRTKREPHESLFQFKPQEGGAFNIEDETDNLDLGLGKAFGGGVENDESETGSGLPIPSITDRINKRAQEEMAERSEK